MQLRVPLHMDLDASHAVKPDGLEFSIRQTDLETIAIRPLGGRECAIRKLLQLPEGGTRQGYKYNQP